MEGNEGGTKWTWLAALAPAALASVCCIGPLVAAALGVGGLGLAAGLVRYRPLFLTLTGTALAAGFYMTYRKRRVDCADGRCELRSGSKTMKATLWTTTIFAVALASFPRWSPYFLTAAAPAVPAGAQVMTFQIAGMDCAACAAGIEKSVGKVPGVYSAHVDFDQAQAKVETDGKVAPEAVVAAIKTAGYQATSVAGDDHGKPRS